LGWCAAGIVAALLTAAPVHADPNCPNGKIVTSDCVDNCRPGDVQVRCAPPPNDSLEQTWPLVGVSLGVGIGIG